MCDDKRKMYPKKETGTVPKIKYRNKNDARYNYQNVPTKNVHVSCVRDSDQSKLYTNSDLQKKNILRTHYCMMEQLGDEEAVRKQNSMMPMSNGSVSSHSTSTSESRRNSVGTVCNKNDNVTKYPDKKQIEDKLNQIKEYIQATSSLISNMKNTDEQSNADEVANLLELINNLKDSERKLLATLTAIETFEAEQVNCENKELSENDGEQNDGTIMENRQNDIEKRVLHANREIEKLQQDNLLLNLQIKAENQMRNAIKAQQKLMQQSAKEMNHTKNTIYQDDTNENHLQHQINSLTTDPYATNTINTNSNKQLNEVHHENMKDIEERLKHLNDSQTSISSSVPSGSNIHESLMTQIDSINHKIGYLRDVNDQGAQLIQVLDNRDLQLQNEHTQLQAKLKDLQEKKLQVDSLVSQLETMNEESEEDDVRDQVRKIITMKEQLEKLKSILEVVKNTETLIERQQQNYNESDNEVQECSSNLQPQICGKTDNLRCAKNKTLQDAKSESNISNKELKNQKQANKFKMNPNERERIKLQSELQAKKRELEELMFKHKAVTSNLNQDFHIDNKPDHALLENESNTWYPAPNLYNMSEYSSDECAEDEEQSQENSIDNNKITQIQPMPALNYVASNYIKHDLDSHIDSGTEYSHLSSKGPGNSRNSLTMVQSPSCARDTACPNNNNELDKYQIQKQLELIRSVCDTMLDDHNSYTSQVRNNLTPSSIYTEPRQYESANSQNANINTHQNDSLTFPIQNMPTNDVNYQNWLATNTLQTQAFMLNTLNQCCQMLWLQQREIASLRNTVNALQERIPNMQCDTNMTPFLQTNQMLNMDASSTSRQSIPHMRSSVPPNPKLNHVSSATSMPNLNQMQQMSQTNIDTSAAVAYANNLHNARLIDTSSLNNNTFSGVNSNTVLHSANQHLPSQIWNGQVALNNQVAPGNRANNYWDNFRSYSRQNLLSTKTNEGLQNLCTVTDGGSRSSSNCTERSHYNSYAFQPTTLSATSASKTNISNSVPTVTGLPPLMCNRRVRTLFKMPTAHVQNTNLLTNVPPPDVLNVNQIQNTSIKCNDTEIVDGDGGDVLQLPLLNTVDHFHNDNDTTTSTIMPDPPTLSNIFSSDSNLSASATTNQQDHLKNWRRQINRNEWHEEAQDNSNVKSKLFEALRENVYKEVASLISANQGRPHFLIQLFRDLQLISSDPLRRQTLQSIQSLITQAQVFDQQSVHSDVVNLEGNLAPDGAENPIPEYLNAAFLFLNKHADDKLHNDLMEVFKKLLIDTTFNIVFANIKDDVIQKHFISLINETMDQFRNKTIKDVKMIMVHTIEELYRGEISFLRLMRDNLIENHIENEVAFEVPKLFDCNNVVPPQQQIQNADLAEADQSHIDVDEDDDCDEEDNNEEGAVGGLLLLDRGNANISQVNSEDGEVKNDYPGDTEADTEYTEGLDQVPTRLTTQSLKLTGTSTNTKNKKDGLL